MDIWDAMTNPQIQATPAMIASLRNQNLLGQLGQLTGDKVLSPLGQSLSQEAYQQGDVLGKNALTEQARRTQQQYRDTQEQHYQEQSQQAKNALAETMRAHKAEEELKRAEMGLTSSGERDDDFQTHVDRIGKYLEKPLNASATKNPRNYAIMAEVARQYPEFDDTFYNNKLKTTQAFGGQGKQGQTLRSADVAIQHLKTLDGAVDALNNGDVGVWNSAKNIVKTQLGLSTAPTDFEAIKPIVSDELTKFILGSGGGVTDREQMQLAVSSARSPAQLKSVIARYKDLMHGQVMGLKQEYEQNTQLGDFESKLSPVTRAELGLGGDSGPHSRSGKVMSVDEWLNGK